MADIGRREVVSDPLALNAREQPSERQLALSGIRTPGGTGGVDMQYAEQMGAMKALSNLGTAMQGTMAAKKDDAITEGKIAYMTGITEEDMLKRNDRYQTQGYQALSTVEDANNWYNQELASITDEKFSMDPAAYQKDLMERRKEKLNNLPKDPALRKIYTAAFEDMGTRLATDQFTKNNEYNKVQTVSAFVGAVTSGSMANADATRPAGGLRISPNIVSRPLQSAAGDRDVGIRTLLGEAGGEGPEGMAAVAHVLKNRAFDSRWGGSITDIAKAPQQFSTWNAGAGGNGPDRIDPHSAAYKRAGEIFDAVMSGNVVDPTAGATHFYSPVGMAKLVVDGKQTNILPKWLQQEAEASGGQLAIGGHIFVGRGRGIDADRRDPATQEPLQVDANANPQSVARAEGVVPDSTTYGTTAAQIAKSYPGLPSNLKTAALSDAVRRSLAEGNDQLFNDLGGVGFFTQMGAKPQEIDEVIKAKAAYDKKKDEEYSEGEALWQQDLFGRIKSGAIDGTAAIKEISAKREEGMLTSTRAKALSNTVIEKAATVGEMISPEVMGGFTKIYNAAALKVLTPEQAAVKTAEWAKANNVPKAKAESYMQRIFDADSAELKKSITDAQTTHKKAVKETEVKSRALESVAANRGTKGLSGKVTLADGTEGSVDDFVIEQLNANAAKQASEAIKNGVAQTGEAGREEITTTVQAQAQTGVYSKLALNDIVDVRFGQAMTAALSGDIIDPKTGGPTQGALDSFDFYLRMSRTPEVGPEYLSRMYTDSRVRAVLTTAAARFDGRGNMMEALTSAHRDIYNPSFDPKNTVDRGQPALLNSLATASVNKQINELAGTSFWSRVTGSGSISEAMQKRVLENNGAAINFVTTQAGAYYVQHGQGLDMKRAVQMGTEDLANRSTIVGGNLIIGAGGSTLMQDMGVNSTDKTLPNAIITDYLREYGSTYFNPGSDTPNAQNPFDAQLPSTAGVLARNNGFAGIGAGPANLYLFAREEMSVPDFRADYDYVSKTMTLSLFKDKKTGELLTHKRMVIPMQDLGRWYSNKQREAPMGASLFNDISNFTADTVRGVQDTDVDDNAADLVDAAGDLLQ